MYNDLDKKCQSYVSVVYQLSDFFPSWKSLAFRISDWLVELILTPSLTWLMFTSDDLWYIWAALLGVNLGIFIIRIRGFREAGHGARMRRLHNLYPCSLPDYDDARAIVLTSIFGFERDAFIEKALWFDKCMRLRSFAEGGVDGAFTYLYNSIYNSKDNSRLWGIVATFVALIILVLSKLNFSFELLERWFFENTWHTLGRILILSYALWIYALVFGYVWMGIGVIVSSLDRSPRTSNCMRVIRDLIQLGKV